MKAFAIYIFIGLLGFIPLKAQIILTQEDLPSVNDTLRYSMVTSLNGYDFQQTGENFHWDFSNLNFQTQELEDYKSVSSVNFFMGLLFGSETMALSITDMLPLDEFEVEAEDFYAVYHKTAQQYTQDGFFFLISGLPIPLKYQQKDYVYKLPLAYADNDSTAFYGNLSLEDTLHFERDGYRVNNVDGWGTIETPYGEFECLRVKTTLYESDSLFWASLPEPVMLKRTTTQYKWLAKEEKFPVMEASFVQFENEDEIFLGVRYRDIYREPQQTPAPVANFFADITEAEPNQPITFTNESTPDHQANTYLWAFEPNHVEFLSQTTVTSIEPVVEFTEPGTYSVTLNAYNETASDSHHKQNYITISNTGEPVNSENVRIEKPLIFLSEDGSRINIEGLQRTASIVITDIHGRESHTADKVSSGNSFIVIADFKPGVYMVTLYSDETSSVIHHAKILIP